MKMKDLWLNVANEIEANPRCFDFYTCTVPEAPAQLSDPDNPPIGCFVGLLARAYGCPKGLSVSMAARIMLTAVGAPDARWSNDSDFYRPLNRACILRDVEGWRTSPAAAVQAIRWVVEDMEYRWLDAELPDPETIRWRRFLDAEEETEVEVSTATAVIVEGLIDSGTQAALADELMLEELEIENNLMVQELEENDPDDDWEDEEDDDDDLDDEEDDED